MECAQTVMIGFCYARGYPTWLFVFTTGAPGVARSAHDQADVPRSFGKFRECRGS